MFWGCLINIASKELSYCPLIREGVVAKLAPKSVARCFVEDSISLAASDEFTPPN